MAKRLSEKQKENIIKLFINGKTIDELSKEFKRTKLTITRNLKNKLGESEYKEFIKTSRSSKQSLLNDKKHDLTINEKVDYDLFYLENRSLLLNLTILIKTIKQIVKPKGISH